MSVHPLGGTVVQLHRRETASSGYWGHPGICTVTFCEGSADAALRSLRPRVRACLEANPWVAGKLDAKRRLVHPEGAAAAEDAVLNEVLAPEVKICAAVKRGTSYPALVKATGGNAELAVQPGAKLRKSGARVAKMVVVKSSESARDFAIVFSMSHVSADGHDYYRILNMIAGPAPTAALDPRRLPEYEAREAEWTGPRDFAWLSGGAGLIKGMLGGLLFGPKSRWSCFEVDPVKLAEAKRSAMLGGPSQAPAGVEFASTNDVLTSQFCSAARARVAMMVVNMRGKIPLPISDDHAGCYEGCLLLDEANYASPGGVRACLNAGVPFTRQAAGSLPLPGACGSCPMAFITNWASFPWELQVDGVEQTLHLPCMDMPDMMDVAVVFKPRGGSLAMLCLAKRCKGRLLGESSVLGPEVDKSMFPA